jgi:hypothetical protein
LNIAALKHPPVWPSYISHFWWNKAAPEASTVSLILAIVILVWPISAALTAPVLSTLLLNGGKALALLAVVHYYRAALLSATPSSDSEALQNTSSPAP